MKRRITVGVLFALLSAGSLSARSDELDDAPAGPEDRPLWEVGVFVGAARLPHYRGSDEYTLYVLPLPYLIYRGEILKADREGFKGVFWENDRIETGLSLSGNPPVDKDNKAREDMPELGAIIEFGPMLQYFISDRKNPNPLFITAAVRAAISVDTDNLNMDYQGLIGGLKTVYRNRTWLEDQDVSLGASAGIDFADQDYNSYFYDVDPAYATVSRPAYSADGGYAGFSFSMHASKKITDRWSIGAYYRWDTISGAVYRDSPLVKTENNHIIGCALIWNILRSAEKVPR
jgi:outer membrane scaffolding protein for murein synthesis (MipA/OmpV family)